MATFSKFSFCFKVAVVRWNLLLYNTHLYRPKIYKVQSTHLLAYNTIFGKKNYIIANSIWIRSSPDEPVKEKRTVVKFKILTLMLIWNIVHNSDIVIKPFPVEDQQTKHIHIVVKSNKHLYLLFQNIGWLWLVQRIFSHWN